MQVTVVGIAGGSGSGKSTLAHAVLERTQPHSVALSFDSYYKDQRHLSRAARRRVNYDHPDSLDVERFRGDLAMLKAGHTIASPVYDFPADTRSEAIALIDPAPVVVVEGILLFVFDAVCDLIDLRVFVDVPEEIRTERRVARDVAERGRTRAQALAQIDRTVRPMHGEFVQPSAERAHITIDGTAETGASVATLTDVLSSPVV